MILYMYMLYMYFHFEILHLQRKYNPTIVISQITKNFKKLISPLYSLGITTTSWTLDFHLYEY